MSWLLDADVLSQPAKRSGNQQVLAWLEKEKDRCYTSSVAIGQLVYWVRTKEGRQRADLQRWLMQLLSALEGRIYGFNVGVAHVWADNSGPLTWPACECLSPTALSPRRRGSTI